jgi:hypothetical protein
MQTFDERRVRLAMNFHKWYAVNNGVRENFGIKGIRSAVTEPIEHVIFRCRHNWRKLEKVTD